MELVRQSFYHSILCHVKKERILYGHQGEKKDLVMHNGALRDQRTF